VCPDAGKLSKSEYQRLINEKGYGILFAAQRKKLL
jgi:hypothetical protein